MSNRNHKRDEGLSMQPDLFGEGPVEGALDIHLGFRQCLSRSMHDSSKDRYQGAAEMSRLMRASISKETLDKCAASDPSHGLRAEALTSFCYVYNTYEPFQYLLEPLAAEVVTAVEMKYLKLARLEEQKRKLETEIQIIRSQCGIK